MLKYCVFIILLAYSAYAADKCDLESHPTLGVMGSCIEIAECNSKGGIYEHGWCMSKSTTVKCCFIEPTQAPTTAAPTTTVAPATTAAPTTTEQVIVDKCDTTVDPSLGKGECMQASSCPGVYVDNWCMSKPASVKCCFKEKNWDNVCQGGGMFYPHPEPTKFIMCSNGWKFVFDCPVGLVWHQDKSWCDFPEERPQIPEPNIGTGIEDLIDGFPEFFEGDDLDLTFSEVTEAPSKDRCDTEAHPDFGRGECKEMSQCSGLYVNNWCQSKAASVKCCFPSNTEWNNICSQGGQLYPHPEPNKYIHCAHGYPYVKDCPSGQIWISEKQWCDYAPAAPSKPVSDGIKRGIDVDFLKQVEGYHAEAYCLDPVKYPKSGVTIGVGVDFGSKDATMLRNAGVSEAIIKKVEPYFGLKAADACAIVNVYKVVLSEAEALQLSDASIKIELDLVRSRYNSAKASTSLNFDDLTCAQRTIIASVLYQYGSPTRVPKFWNAVLANDWATVVSELRNFGDAYATRRTKEADLIEYGSSAKDCPPLGADICQATTGSCIAKSSCTGKLLSNFCQNQASTIMCCASSTSTSSSGSTSGSTTGKTVKQVVDEAKCSTGVVSGLATQLVEYINRIKPNMMTDLTGASRISLSGAAAEVPYIQTTTYNYIKQVLVARSGSTLTINSALRTLPQQLILYKWYQNAKCGITLAAKPGSSNHESGLAVDVQESSAWRTAFESNSCKWQGSNDPMHYTCPGSSLGTTSTIAFQKLWNCNNPNDKIAEDGAYGPTTEAKLLASPVGGFPNLC